MTQMHYYLLPLYKKIPYKIFSTIFEIFKGIFMFIIALPKNLVKGVMAIGRGVKSFAVNFVRGDWKTKLSYLIMGSSNILRGQIIKGLIFLAGECGFIYFMYAAGAKYLVGLKTLGTKKMGWVLDESQGIEILQEGDNSMLFLLYGVFTLFVILAFIFLYLSNLSSAREAEEIQKSGKKLPNFVSDVRSYLDNKLYKSMLFIPLTGLIMFTVVPLVYMILIAFTNYDRKHQVPANLFNWVGIENFKEMLASGSVLSRTFWPVLGWTLTWAVFATLLNYVFGIILAMMINKKGIKGKSFFRTNFVLSIAIPQFVSLLVMRNILHEKGPINILLQELGVINSALPFLTDPTWARISIIVVNLWIGIPYTMLITSGILMNIPEDLYESARIDGASPALMFRKITLPYVLFVTTPYLITQFIGNINNFNVIFFLTGGTPATLDYYQAGKTDLLVTWLYKLTVDTRDYSFASTIGILVFIISATFSLFTYRRTSSYKGEEDFQ